jgi:hypothetical protein
MFGQLLAMILSARMMRQNLPNPPRGSRTAARRPPLPDSSYPSMYLLLPSLMVVAVKIAIPRNWVKRRGIMRPSQTAKKTLVLDWFDGW